MYSCWYLLLSNESYFNDYLRDISQIWESPAKEFILFFSVWSFFSDLAKAFLFFYAQKYRECFLKIVPALLPSGIWLGWGCIPFHSDPSIIFKEQLLTFCDFKPTFLFSLILAVSLYSFFLFAFMSNCFRCTLNKIREFLLISQYWGTLWSHQLWAVCHNMTLFMQERVLTKLASDVPRLNLSRKVVQVCDWLLNWYSGSHVYWWLIYFYFLKNKESVWIWYWILSLHCEPKSMPRWISMPEPTKALNIMFVTHVYWSSY